MTPERRKQLDSMGRTQILESIEKRHEMALQNDFIQDCREWISEDDRSERRKVSDSARDARRAMIAAWVAAIAAMIAAIWPIFKH